MKNLIISFFVWTFIITVHASDLPTDFYSNDQAGFDVDSKSIDDVSKTLKDYFKASDKMNEELNFSESKPSSGWTFSGFVTTLGISSSGKLGLVGFKGTAATEIYWREKRPPPAQIIPMTNNEENNSNLDMDADIEFSDVSEEGIDEQVENAFALVKASGKVSNLDVAKIGIRERMRDFAALVNGLYADPTKPFYFSGLRFDLTVGATGAVAGTPFTIGGTVVIRMIWRPIRKIDSAFATSHLSERKSDLQKIINDTALSLETLNDITQLSERGFKLQTIRIGYGLSLDGKIQLVSLKSSLIFSAIFDKNPKYQKSLIPSFQSPTFATTGIRTDESTVINWNKFQKGLNKSIKISKPFLKRADKTKSKWEISMVRLTFTVSDKHGIGLVTVGSIGQFEIDFTK